jgi:hypothetical protein
MIIVADLGQESEEKEWKIIWAENGVRMGGNMMIGVRIWHHISSMQDLLCY